MLLEAYGTLLSGVLAEDMPPARARQLERMRGAASLARSMGASADSWAGQVLRNTISHRDWLAADETRARLAAQVRPLFGRVDVDHALITGGGVPARSIGVSRDSWLELSDGTKAPYVAMLRWIALATACGLPATAIPVGQTPLGLPVGAQLIGPRGGDSRTLAAAEAIETRLGGFVAPALRTTAS